MNFTNDMNNYQSKQLITIILQQNKMAYTTSNLVIIGNGFDLAHGLRTSYNDFLNGLIEEELDKPKNERTLFSFDKGISRGEIEKTALFEAANPHMELKEGKHFSNHFFAKLFAESLLNWCDIEGFYFSELEKCLAGKQEIRTTNREFEIIKNRFEEYLVKHTKDKKPINSYQAFFDKLHEETLILNFNYTDTVQQYVKEKYKIVNIHGELQNPNNPIIFGYAAKEEDLPKLYEKNDNQYLFNIKQNRYGDSISESRLDSFLAKAAQNESNQGLYKGIRIFIFGHSCGISDEYILHRIVNHPKVSEIKIFYYDGIPHQHYEIRTNLKRIMSNRTQEHKIQNIHKCHRMPQINDNEEQEKAFVEYLGNT